MSADLRPRIHELAKACADRNWDSHGAYPLDPGAVERAHEVAESLADRDGWRVFPRSNGGITFEHDDESTISVCTDGTYIVELTGLARDELFAVLAVRHA